MASNNSEYAQQYYQRNKEKILLRNKERQTADPEKHREYQKKYRQANPDTVRQSRLKWQCTLSGCLNRKLHHLKKAKRGRTLEVDIDIDFLLSLWEKQKGLCAISSYPMSYSESSLFGVSVDRIRSVGGYTRDNVQLLCQGMNFAKNKYSNEEMIEFWNYRTTGENHEQAPALSEAGSHHRAAA